MITQYSYGKETIDSAKANVIDYYKQWTSKEIRADLQKNRTDIEKKE